MPELRLDNGCRPASLDELLADGATQLLMRSDGVGEDALRALLVSVKRAQAPAPASGCAFC